MCESVEIFYKKDGYIQVQRGQNRKRRAWTATRGTLFLYSKEEFFHCQQLANLGAETVSQKQFWDLIFLVKMMDPSLAEKPNNF